MPNDFAPPLGKANIVDGTERLFPLVPQQSPTIGMSSAYVPAPYPKHIHLDRDKFVVVNNEEEEKKVLDAGGSTDRADFPEPPPKQDDMSKLQQQVEMLQAAVAGLSANKPPVKPKGTPGDGKTKSDLESAKIGPHNDEGAGPIGVTT